MNWFADNFWKLFDGLGASLVAALLGWAMVRFSSRSDPPNTTVRDFPLSNSSVASGSGNPIQIHGAREVHIGQSVSTESKPAIVATSPNLQYAGSRTKQIFISPVPREGISDPSNDHQRENALQALVLKFENHPIDRRTIARAENVIAKIRFRSKDLIKERSIDYGVWLNCPCNSTDIGIGDTCELVLLCVIDNELIAFDDRRIGNRYFPDNFSYLEGPSVQELELVEITLIDQRSQCSLYCNLRVWREGDNFCVKREERPVQ